MTLPPFPIGIDFPPEVGGQPVTGMQWTAFTFPFNLTGHPAASVPAGWTADGLPIGLQIVGRRWRDDVVLRACAAFEAVQPWADRRPPALAVIAESHPEDVMDAVRRVAAALEYLGGEKTIRALLDLPAEGA